MGIIKTAIISGAAIYGVNQLSKASQDRHAAHRNDTSNKYYDAPHRREACDCGGHHIMQDDQHRREQDVNGHRRIPDDSEPRWSTTEGQRRLVTTEPLQGGAAARDYPHHHQDSLTAYDDRFQYVDPLGRADARATPSSYMPSYNTQSSRNDDPSHYYTGEKSVGKELLEMFGSQLGRGSQLSAGPRRGASTGVGAWVR